MGLASAEGAGSTVVRRREAAGSPHQNAGRCEDGHDGHDREECLVRKRGGVDMRLVPRFVCRSERGAGIAVACDIEPCLVGRIRQVDQAEPVVSRCRRGAAANRSAEHVVVVQNGSTASQNGRDVRVDDLDGVAADVFDCRGVVVGTLTITFADQEVDVVGRVRRYCSRHVDRSDLHVGGEPVEKSDVASRRGFRHRVIHLLQRADSNGRRVGIEGRRRDRAVGVQRRNEAGGEGSEQVARAGRGSRIRRVDVTRKGADRYGSGAGRCQVRGAGDVGGCPVEGGCRGIGAAVEVEHAGESSDEHEAQCSCKPVSTKKLCDFGHVASLL